MSEEDIALTVYLRNAAPDIISKTERNMSPKIIAISGLQVVATVCSVLTLCGYDVSKLLAVSVVCLSFSRIVEFIQQKDQNDVG